MHEHGPLPRARRDDLLEEAVGEELLLYDRDSHTAHCLSPIAACVWRHCNGERNIAELGILAEASESLVADALHELHEKDLLAAEPAPIQGTIPGESRREAISRAARYGAAVAGSSLIISATAATPAMASTIVWSCEPKMGSTCCLCRNDCVGTFPFTLEGERDCEIHCSGFNKGGYVSFSDNMACSP